jgi:hypothetical protein
MGLATHTLDEQAYARALTLAMGVLADETSSDQLRQRARTLAQAARAHLAPEEVQQIELS